MERSPSSRRAWIEIELLQDGHDRKLSPSSRRAWIEIQAIPLTEPARRVALLAEGVDRNISWNRSDTWNSVALLAEGVDRNSQRKRGHYEKVWSPSSRRAWIEIGRWCWGSAVLHVALLAEGVDRNIVHRYKARSGHVALLAEGVDRNRNGLAPMTRVFSRPPRGGRG